MKIAVYPADRFGCGMFRLGWPAQQVKEQSNHEVRITFPDQRWDIGAKLNSRNEVVGVVAPDVDLIVIQRVTHHFLMSCIPFWQERGIKVVVDVDDDLSCIHPSNPAWTGLRPGNGHHNWNHLQKACSLADGVTVSTPALAARYRADAFVLPNFLPDSYFGLDRKDSTDVMWPASLGSHPNDGDELRPALERVQRDTGCRVRMLGPEEDAPAFQRAIGLRQPPEMTPFCTVDEWPHLLASIGVGVVPLADTMFNNSKSWLKILELSAVGVPWVASPRADNQRWVNQAGVGVLADRPNEWRRKLRMLLESESLRADQSGLLREAAEKFRIRDHAWRWQQAWEAIASR